MQETKSAALDALEEMYEIACKVGVSPHFGTLNKCRDILRAALTDAPSIYPEIQVTSREAALRGQEMLRKWGGECEMCGKTGGEHDDYCKPISPPSTSDYLEGKASPVAETMYAPSGEDVREAVERLREWADCGGWTALQEQDIETLIRAAQSNPIDTARLEHYKRENAALRKEIEIYKSAHKDELQ